MIKRNISSKPQLDSRTSAIPLILRADETNIIRLLASRIEAALCDPSELRANTNVLRSIAIKMYKDRRQRVHYFNTEFFGEPAWDMLLAAYCFGEPDNDLTVSGLCYASDCPPTTALRWTAILVKNGLLHRYPCPNDGRKTFIGLTGQARDQIENYLRRIGN